MSYNIQIIKDLLDSAGGEELKAFLFTKINFLKDISNVAILPNAEDQTVELKSQRKAYYKIKAIFEEILSFEASNVQKVKDSKDSYAV